MESGCLVVFPSASTNDNGQMNEWIEDWGNCCQKHYRFGIVIAPLFLLSFSFSQMALFGYSVKNAFIFHSFRFLLKDFLFGFIRFDRMSLF